MPKIKSAGGKVYIERVPKISWDTGEICEFASALASATSCLGEHIPYHYIMGTSGVAFRFTLNPGAWDFGNYSIRNMSADPYEPIRRAINATGYDYALSHQRQLLGEGDEGDNCSRHTSGVRRRHTADS